MINKASLLTDETAQAYGFTTEQLEGVVPDDVLNILKDSLILQDGELETILGESVTSTKTYYTTFSSSGSSSYTVPVPFPPSWFAYYTELTFQGRVVNIFSFIFKGYSKQVVLRQLGDYAQFTQNQSGYITGNNVTFSGVSEMTNYNWSGTVYCFAIG